MERVAPQQFKKESSITPEIIQNIKGLLDIEAIIGGHVELKKKGGVLSGLCPFHSEKTPSFYVSKVKGLYHCFSCKKGGDLISFVKEKDGLTFPEAIKFLADKAGITLELDKKEQESLSFQKRLLELNFKTAKSWTENLSKTESAQNYLTNRGVTKEIQDIFELGVASDSWDDIKKVAETEGFSRKEFFQTGLISISKNKHFDLFRDRLMIPIKDLHGRIIAFGGRSLGETPPKYLNSPETALYAKKRHLFGLYNTKDCIKEKGFAILTEGFFDTISLYTHGVQNVVSCLGTALTEEQGKLLKRFTDKVVINFDGDKAGISATKKAIEILTRLEFTVKVLILPEGKDPDEFIRENGALKFNQLRGSADSWFQFILKETLKDYNISEPSEKSKALQELFTYINTVKSPVEQREYFDSTVRALKIDPSLYKTLWANISSKNVQQISLEVSKESLGEKKLIELLTCVENRKEIVDKVLSLNLNLSITPILLVLSDSEIDYQKIEDTLDESSKELLLKALFNTEVTLAVSSDITKEVDNCVEYFNRLAILKKLSVVDEKLTSATDEEVLELCKISHELRSSLKVGALGSHQS